MYAHMIDFKIIKFEANTVDILYRANPKYEVLVFIGIGKLVSYLRMNKVP